MKLTLNECSHLEVEPMDKEPEVYLNIYHDRGGHEKEECSAFLSHGQAFALGSMLISLALGLAPPACMWDEQQAATAEFVSRMRRQK